jgi:hypothetical protein
MGDPRDAIVLIARSDLVPDLGYRDRRAVIFLNNELKSIVEHKFMYGWNSRLYIQAIEHKSTQG